MEQNFHYVQIKEVLQKSKSLDHLMEESPNCKSQTSKYCYSLKDILSHDSNSITTSCEANSTETSMTLKMNNKLHYVTIEEVIQPSKLLQNSMGESLRYESQNLSHDSDLIKSTPTFPIEENPLNQSHNIVCPIQDSMNKIYSMNPLQ